LPSSLSTGREATIATNGRTQIVKDHGDFHDPPWS
jgi:hypothetical protein